MNQVVSHTLQKEEKLGAMQTPWVILDQNQIYEWRWSPGGKCMKRVAVVDLVKRPQLIVEATEQENKSHFVEKTWKTVQGKWPWSSASSRKKSDPKPSVTSNLENYKLTRTEKIREGMTANALVAGSYWSFELT